MTVWDHIHMKNYQSGMVCLHYSPVYITINLCNNIPLVISDLFIILENLIHRLCPETKLIRSAMELFPTSVKENTKKRRKWGPIRSETDGGYEHLPNLVPKEENKIR